MLNDTLQGSLRKLFVFRFCQYLCLHRFAIHRVGMYIVFAHLVAPVTNGWRFFIVKQVAQIEIIDFRFSYVRLQFFLLTLCHAIRHFFVEKLHRSLEQ